MSGTLQAAECLAPYEQPNVWYPISSRVYTALKQPNFWWTVSSSQVSNISQAAEPGGYQTLSAIVTSIQACSHDSHVTIRGSIMTVT